jgi:hypothetical protein
VVVLELLTWTVIGGCVLTCVAVVGCFAASAASDLAYRPKVHWEPGGPWYPPTDPAATTPLGALPTAVEAELERIWTAIGPERAA